MKRSLFIMIVLAFMTAAQGKKVTIEGTSSSERIYLIINEDTEHALLLDIQDGKFSVTVNVNRNAFIRLQESKTFPRRAAAVLIPDSKHIIVDTDNQLIQNSLNKPDLFISAGPKIISNSDPAEVCTQLNQVITQTAEGNVETLNLSGPKINP